MILSATRRRTGLPAARRGTPRPSRLRRGAPRPDMARPAAASASRARVYPGRLEADNGADVAWARSSARTCSRSSASRACGEHVLALAPSSCRRGSARTAPVRASRFMATCAVPRRLCKPSARNVQSRLASPARSRARAPLPRSTHALQRNAGITSSARRSAFDAASSVSAASICEHVHVVRFRRRYPPRLAQRHALVVAATLLGAALPRVVHEDARIASPAAAKKWRRLCQFALAGARRR